MAKTTEPFQAAQKPRWRCTFLFVYFATLLRCGQGQSIFHDAPDALKSWGDLNQEAGYFTHSGVWKGGLPMLHRSSSSESYSCETTHAAFEFCLRWMGGYVENEGPLTQETCICTSSDELFCQEWECRRTRDFEPCDLPVRECIKDRETRITSCICEEAAENYPICQQWSCQEFTIFGSEQLESYVCLQEDQSGNYCYRWSGNITSDSHVKSTVCDCFDRDERHCRLWICDQREITRCSASGPFMCDAQFAIGVCGGVGMVFNFLFLGAAACIRDSYRDRRLEALAMFIIGFLVTMLPLMIGAAVTGGVYGIGWVIVIWAVPIVLFVCYWRSYY